MTPPTSAYAGIMSGFNMVIAHLIRQLDERGALSKDEFATQIECAILDKPIKDENGRIRYDRLLIENLVEVLRSQQSQPWTPEIIRGGLSEPPDDENSDP
jgi:hypothetical protein